MKRDYIEFDERSVPKGYLITFRCYGTWLQGDERGSVDRRFYNRLGVPKIRPDEDRVRRQSKLLEYEPYFLGPQERSIVKTAIEEVCSFRGYGLYALNVRTEHVHSVTDNCGVPERVMDSFKAYSTRALRENGLIEQDRRPWSRHGSTKYLWTEEHISQAVEYVLHGQGGELPTFD
jgi:REP element-mobilizing transposase RayT